MHHHHMCSSGPVLFSPKHIFYSLQMANATSKPLSHAAQTANTGKRQPWISAAPPLSSNHNGKHQNGTETCFWPPSGVLASLRGFDLSLLQKGERKSATTDMNPLYPFSFLQWYGNQAFLKYCYFTLIALTFALAV